MGGRMDAMNVANHLSDETLGIIFAHLDSPADRSAVSMVCRQWKRVDSNTRKYVQIANCYSIAPAALPRRFPNLVSLKIKGKPRACEFELLPPNWGGHATAWINEVAEAYSHTLESLWLRRMVVTDADLELLATSCYDSLLILKLEKCEGFSAAGLGFVTARCRLLKVLYLEESTVKPSENSGAWLHELAINNPNLEDLNFQYTTGLDDIDLSDLELLADNCRSLRSLKVAEAVDITEIERVVSRTVALEELGTGSCAEIGDQIPPLILNLPRSIVALSGCLELSDSAVPTISHVLANLKKLDLLYSLLSTEGYCQILQHCTNLEVLLARNGLGDAGLNTVARTCKKLRRIRIDDSEGEGRLTPAGIIPLAENCVKLEFCVLYVTDISNATLVAFGKNCSVLKDCRFVVLSTLVVLPDLPLDEGVKALLKGCRNLARFALYVRHGALTDRGMAYIGEYGGRLKWILLGCTGESDLGFAELARGCQSLQSLEMRDCPFTEAGCAAASAALQSLKFMWIQGRNVSEAGGSLLAAARPCWIVEIGQSSQQVTAYCTAYCSLTGPRRDYPKPEISIIQAVYGENAHVNGAV